MNDAILSEAAQARFSAIGPVQAVPMTCTCLGLTQAAHGRPSRLLPWLSSEPATRTYVARRRAEALADATAAIELQPDADNVLSRGHFVRGLVLVDLRRADEAVPDL